MKLGWGLNSSFGSKKTLAAGGPIYDTDAMAWFAAVEASGATFGPDPATANTNKMAWSNWVIAQKNAESPIAGRSNWDQLTEPGEGYIQPLMGVSTFNIPALFGDSTFVNFVSGDYDPATGLRGEASPGENRLLISDRVWDDTPIDDMSAGALLTGAPTTDTLSSGRIVGAHSADTYLELLTNDGRVRNRAETFDDTTALFEASTPRTVAMSRNDEDEFQVFNGSIYVISRPSSSASSSSVVFLNDVQLNRASNARIGIAFYGRSINLKAMNTACVALSEAITWST